MCLSLTLHVPARSLRCLVINKVLFCSNLNVSLLAMTIFHRHVGKGIMAFDSKLLKVYKSTVFNAVLNLFKATVC